MSDALGEPYVRHADFDLRQAHDEEHGTADEVVRDEEHDGLGRAACNHCHESRFLASPVVRHGAKEAIGSETNEICSDQKAYLLPRHTFQTWHLVEPVVDVVLEVFVRFPFHIWRFANLLCRAALIVRISRQQAKKVLL